MFKYNAEELYKHLHSLIGKQIWIAESISRDREVGHNRHFATLSAFRLTLQSVHWSMSGANFYLDGIEGFSYSLSSLDIVEFKIDEKECLIIIEHFEAKTERETKLWIEASLLVS